ncbi:hypothetical protein [Halobacterium salinarum]|uniref:Uncharacterized protein n=2 Tax=Halobacterium salinarum TaxID=2242 RepID=A0A841HBA3_HALSI|nr:hypothetical protein [Halobacterium salinarum]MBB6089953.1 hypothetical protein [Halobacterium salinarum]MCF2207874.1 hypothetical protein [Halobacterium salinarum]MCF2238343.1 hypothetical protein [Halobacterium salinarum]MCF2241374.1 hypothetical protein [Halobacterium salinarum]MDL0120670.1 hypothetical protein [Halobacterium salinarum]
MSALPNHYETLREGWDAAVDAYTDSLAAPSRAWPSEGKRSTHRGC